MARSRPPSKPSDLSPTDDILDMVFSEPPAPPRGKGWEAAPPIEDHSNRQLVDPEILKGQLREDEDPKDPGGYGGGLKGLVGIPARTIGSLWRRLPGVAQIIIGATLLFGATFGVLMPMGLVAVDHYAMPQIVTSTWLGVFGTDDDD